MEQQLKHLLDRDRERERDRERIVIGRERSSSLTRLPDHLPARAPSSTTHRSPAIASTLTTHPPLGETDSEKQRFFGAPNGRTTPVGTSAQGQGQVTTVANAALATPLREQVAAVALQHSIDSVCFGVTFRLLSA